MNNQPYINNQREHLKINDISEQQYANLDALIVKTWNKLSLSTIISRKTNPHQFFAAIKKEYNIEKAEATRTLKILADECGIADNSFIDNRSINAA